MDTHIFKEKLLALQNNLLSFAITLTNNRDDAYDLLQDTDLKVLDNQAMFTENTNFKGWIFTIMRNIFINNYRRANKIQMINDDSDDQYQLNTPDMDTAPSPEDSYGVREITEAIDSFSDDYRIPLSMHVAGYRYSEIANYMHLPLGTVKSRIYYARQNLRNLLVGYR